MHVQNLIEFCKSIPKTLNRNIILNQSRAITKLKKKMCNGFYVEFINIYGCAKFDRNPSIDLQDIEHKYNSDANREP